MYTAPQHFSALKRPQILWKDAAELAEKELVGKKEYFEQWPLIKILDIGGKVRSI